jgi:hypothetical protein
VKTATKPVSVSSVISSPCRTDGLITIRMLPATLPASAAADGAAFDRARGPAASGCSSSHARASSQARSSTASRSDPYRHHAVVPDDDAEVDVA